MITNALNEKMLLAGQWVDRGERMEVRDPGNNQFIGTVPKATAKDVKEAIENMQKKRESQGVLPVHERIQIINKAANIVNEKKETFARTIATEGSKTITEARVEVDRTIRILQMSAEEARRIQGKTISFDQVPGSENRVGYYTYAPVGIIGAITAFNDPLNLVTHKLGPALAAGNAVILKPASLTPFSALLLADALLKAGLPPAMLSVVTGKGSELSDALVTHRDIGMVAFTGGLNTGEKIANKGGITKYQMELGSNSAVIVTNNAKIEKAVKNNISGAFSAAGQNCLGVQRIFVHEDKLAEFTNKFVKETKKLTMGEKMSEETDVGPMISETEAKRIEAWVQDAVDAGAEVLCGGERKRAYFTPTVLRNVPKDCKIAYEEVFGPVVSLFSVRHLQDAIIEANAVNYGLQAGIFTNDIEEAYEAIEKLDVGGVMVNDSSDYRIDAMPFGGVKGSGIGREGIEYAVEAMSEKKVVSFNLDK